MAPAAERLHILIPVYDDWEVLALLLRRLDDALAAQDLEADLLVVDDGSSRAAEEALAPPPLQAIAALRVLELKRNLGHQRAIAVGMCFVEKNLEPRPLLVMDGDGEDDPGDIAALLAAYRREEGRKVIFAARQRRSESFAFQLFYRLFQLFHLLLTGRGIRVGNFSLVPPRALERLVVSAEIYSHYAAAVTNTRVPYSLVPTARAKRIAGRSSMNFTSLVVHGLSALSLYSHVIGVRLLALAGGVLAASLAVLGLAVAGGLGGLKLAFFLGLLSLLFPVTVGGLLFVFLLLSLRQMAVGVPSRDFGLFVRRLVEWPAGGGAGKVP
jgi:glycosyltransferase involved in cell wall biosynthesis